ncbi:MAG: bifunctional riboflavin kinase/FAD synthetase [Deltaproteobacteria bacterium]|nr:bifunctional riboflavin kinase/FAD synthetase [Deltaproteobacteria bacterium]
MAIVCNLNNLPDGIKNPVVTIGNFDGVHKGHQTIFKKVIKHARDIKGTAGVITFDPHPIKITAPDSARPLITPLDQKRELILNQGIELFVIINFSYEFSTISATEFIKDVLVTRLGIKEIIVGYDYVFGRHRKGGIELLKRMGKEFDFSVYQIKPVYVGKTLVSSTLIRTLVENGDITEAKRLLGRSYQIRGKVIKGMNRGGPILGYPTANLMLSDELVPKKGVYIVTVGIDGKTFQGLTNIGYNPTFTNNELSVETYIFDFSENILGKDIRLNFLSRLRDEITFTNASDLSQQIDQDVEIAKRFFKNTKYL